MRLFLSTILGFISAFNALAQEAESLEINANTCEKMLEGESPSSARVRAVDKAVLLGLKNLPVFEEDKQILNSHDLNVMLYRIADDCVQDLSSKVVKTDDQKVCVQINGFVNPKSIEEVRKDFLEQQGDQKEMTDEDISEIVSSVDAGLAFMPQSLEDVALVFVAPLEFYNGSTSLKYTTYLKEKVKENPYYYLTEQKDLADYVILPKLLKAKVDTLDKSHKRLQMVLVLEISGLSDENRVVSQNRFLLFSSENDEQEIASRLIKKLINAAAQEAMRKIELKEQKRLEEKTVRRKN